MPVRGRMSGVPTPRAAANRCETSLRDLSPGSGILVTGKHRGVGVRQWPDVICSWLGGDQVLIRAPPSRKVSHFVAVLEQHACGIVSTLAHAAVEPHFPV